MAKGHDSTESPTQVPKQNTRQREIAEAVRVTKKLRRPTSITPVVWRGVLAVLVELSRHTPDPFPSEERLAKRTGYGRASIQRYLYAAQKAGLIKVESFRHGRTWNRNRYSLTWLCAHQFDALCAHQSDALTLTPLRGVNEHPFGVKSEPPSAALAAAGLSQSNPLEAQPTWYPGWDPTRQLGLPPETVWKPNLYAGKCDCCRNSVPSRAGWVTPNPHGVKWFLVHNSVCPRLIEGGRPGERLHTLGEIKVNNARFRTGQL